MKELTIEQKAKAYDIALAKIKMLLGTGSSCSRKELEYVFPELKDIEKSEGERIRKAIINVFASHKDYEVFFGASVEDILAWLEKEAEHANFRNNIQIGDKVTRNEDGVLVNLSQLERIAKKDEKQGKQKPAEWSEEDYKYYDKIGQYLFILLGLTTLPDEIESIGSCIEWLKNKFKFLRPQKNNWERVTKEIYFKEPVLVRRKDKSDAWEGYRVCNDYTLNPQTDECYILIKDINNQRQWKPSEEMLEALYRAIPENVMEISEDKMLLDKLYQGLKYSRVLSNK